MSLYTRAKLAEKQKNYKQAIEDYGEVLKLDPDFFNAAYAKAACENTIGLYDDAIKTYNLAFSKDVDDSPFTMKSQRTYRKSQFSLPAETYIMDK